MNHQNSLFMLLCAVVLSACSQSVPKCSDEQATTVVKQIADEEMGRQLGTEAAKIFAYDIEAIRTTSTNEKTGAHECAAELKIKTKNAGTHSLPINYTVEKTDDSAQIYVNVFGLK